MLRYHVAFHLPRDPGEMVVVEALDWRLFPMRTRLSWCPCRYTSGLLECEASRAHRSLAKARGCIVKRQGARRSIYSNPANGSNAPVPRHGEIDNRLARKIGSQLGSRTFNKAGQPPALSAPKPISSKRAPLRSIFNLRPPSTGTAFGARSSTQVDRLFDVGSPEEFRKALAAIVDELAR